MINDAPAPDASAPVASSSVSPGAYGLLGLLATRSWTGYELTQQVQRSLRFAYPTSEGHLYREQKRLVDLGWATVERERVGRRTRNRYRITDDGRAALVAWHATPPQEPHLQIEGVLRLFHGHVADPQDLASALHQTASLAREMLGELGGFVDEYLEDGGPLTMLEQGLGGPEGDRLEFHGRPMFPERLPVVAAAVDATTLLLETIATFFADASQEVARWPDVSDAQRIAATRARLEAIRDRLPPLTHQDDHEG